MSHVLHLPQGRDRERTRTLLTEFFKRGDGPWRNEAKLAFRAFHTEGGDQKWPPDPESVRFAERLMKRLEGAAEHVNCGLRGLWLAGVHFVPGQELVHMHSPEGFLLMDNNGGFSPLVVGRDEILLQCGEYPFIFNYTIDTDINPMFKSAIIPGSFF